MEIIEKSSKTVELRLSIDELNTFRNALNEACNGIYVSEFKTRMGVSREETTALSDAILQVLEQLRLTDKTEKSEFGYQQIKKNSMQLIKTVGERVDVQFTIDELLTLNNSLNEVCNGINVIDFETKIGVDREQAKLLLNSVNKLGRELRPPRYIKKNLQARVDQPNSSSITIKQKCVLETNGYQVTFFLRSLDYSKLAVGLGVMLTINPEFGGVTVRSTARFMIPILQTLVSYLKRHINNLKEEPYKTSDLLKYSIFQIQALSGNVTSEDEGSFNLRFMVNTGDPKDRGNTSNYVSAEAVVTFANIRSFTASLQAALDELS